MNNNWPPHAFLSHGVPFVCRRICRSEYRATSGTASDGGTARLIVYRIPTMGKFVIVQVYVDDVMIGGIPYGGKYEGS